ncbi:putative phage abortive infection protein [Cytobacillus kochii]|uniref:putative phage abortive infection protein n=1 Tax=Cytobacillus kochii TaxID=859143 RepID=UPI00402AEB27
MKKKDLWFIFWLLVSLIILFLIITYIPGIELFSEDHWSFFVSITGPTLAFIAFIRTIQVQMLFNKKDSKIAVRTDFYDLIKIMNDYKIDTGEVVDNISEVVYESYRSLNEFPLTSVYMKFNGNFNKIGPFFRCFHRVIKIINEAYEEGMINHKEYKGFIGILRTQFNSSELEFILYNSVLLHRGLGLGIELIGTNFFGNKSDILINQHLEYQKYFEQELLQMFIDDDSDNLPVKKRAKKRKNMRISFQSIVDAIDLQENEKKRNILVNRLSSTNLRRIDEFNFEVFDKDISYIK